MNCAAFVYHLDFKTLFITAISIVHSKLDYYNNLFITNFQTFKSIGSIKTLLLELLIRLPDPAISHAFSDLSTVLR